VALVVGTDEDPQGLAAQSDRLAARGARVVGTVAAAIETVLELLPAAAASAPARPSVDAAALAAPLSAINVGVEAFALSLAAQGAEALQVDWRPPAGGNQKLQAILARMKTVRG
jgi:FdrA protein